MEQILDIGHVIHETSPKTKVCFSGVIKPSDNNELNAKFGEVNRFLKIACSEFGFDYIDNSRIDVSCLNRLRAITLKINLVALIRTLTTSTSTFKRMKEKFNGFQQTECFVDIDLKPHAKFHENPIKIM